MASLLDARIVVVDGRAYRSTADLSRYAGAAAEHQQEEQQEQPAAPRHFEEACDAGEEEADDREYDIRPDGDAFITRLLVDNVVVGFLIGSRGATKARLEQESSARIRIEQRSRDPGDAAEIVVRAGSRAAVASCADKVHLVLDSALPGDRLPYTHFLSIPLAAAPVQQRLQALRAAVLQHPAAAAAGVEESLFADARKLHLTIAMLKLYTEDRRRAAAQVLQRLQPAVRAILAGRPLCVALRRLQCMNDDPSAADVLFLGVEPAEQGSGGRGALQQVCAAAVAALDAAGLLLPRDSREVKLHATVMNTRHRSGGGGGGGRSHAARRPFDARPLLQAFGGTDFGPVELRQLQLSQRGHTDERTGYYHCMASLDLR